MWRSEGLRITCLALLVSFADLFFEPGPLRFLRVLVFLSWIAVLSAGTPILVARPILAFALSSPRAPIVAAATGPITR